MSRDSFDDEDEGTFRQRLWGAAVFIAVMVIVLPLILDGAGSESQFRRVEKLRQEPPSIVDKEGNRTVQEIPVAETPDPEPQVIPAEPLERVPLDIKVGEDDPPDYMKAEQEVRDTLRQSRSEAPLTAWIVQAGSFSEELNAVAVRDRLREAGFASFVRDRDSPAEPFRVLVGPMITEQSALATESEVESLLGRAALVLSYP